MANANFIVQNGISIGGSAGATITADPTTGAVAIAPAATAAVPNPTATVFTTAGTTTTVSTVGGVPSVANIATAANTAAGLSILASGGSNVTVNSGNITFGLGNANVATFTTTTAYGGNLVMNGSIFPSANVTYQLGSLQRQWKDIFVGPGSLYVNGKAVIQDTSGTITFSTDINQNLSIQTSGTGDIQINPSGTGAVALQGTIKVTAGKNFTSSDGNAIGFSNQIAVDSITSKSSNTDLTITAAGNGKVNINDDCAITGNLTVTGTTTTVNSTTLSIADNLIDLNSDVTTGTPTEDAGIRVMRGDSAAVQLKWNETVDNWQLTNDGSSYANIVTTSGGGGSVTFGTVVPSANVTYNLGSTTAYWNNIYASSINAVGVTVNTGKILPGANAVVDIGSTTAWFNTIYGKATQAQYADLAENYQADATYTPGQVVMFGGSQEVTIATADTTAVAGVISTNPAHLMNGGLNGPNVVAVALQGRVPCNVIGPTRKGDLLVSAGFGYARVNNSPAVGTVIGKALVDFTGVKGVIEVVVGRT
jgi:hypothetical protein